MILSFEYDERGELKIFCNEEGAKLLRNFIDKLIEGKDTHYHLMTPSWGGVELTESNIDKISTQINQVLIQRIE